VTDGVEETNHTRGTEKSGVMIMDDRGGEPDAGFDEQDVTLQNMDTQDTVLPSISPTDPLLGRGHRTKQPSTRLQDYVTNTTKRLSPSNCSPSPKVDLSAPYLITDYVNYDYFSLAHCAFLTSISQEKEPVTYTNAVKDIRWRDAMKSEIHALETNETWTVTQLPPGKKALGCKWVYKIKHKYDGSVERFTTRLVILGNHQKEGIDYIETFAPVVKMVMVRTMLAIASARA